MGGYQGNAQGPDSIPPSGGGTYHRDDGETWGSQRVLISSGRGGDGICNTQPHESIHKETADDHSGAGGLLDCLCIVPGGIEDAGDELDGTLVRSRRGK